MSKRRDCGNIIGKSAFEGCACLAAAVIADGVTEIDEFAFCDCAGLVSVTVDGGVTGIGRGAFSYCRALKDINFKGTKAQWEAIEKGSGWNNETGNYLVHCTDGDIEK